MRLFTPNLSTLERQLLRNLPTPIFSVLKDHNLTAGEAQEFVVTGENLEDGIVSVSVNFEPATIDPEHVEIRIYSAVEDYSLNFVFSNKVWLCTSMEHQGRDFIMETSSQQSNEERVVSTVEKGNKVVEIFDQLQPVPNQYLSYS
ncbi:hypothetical protein [Legionella clemsonensis]|uniref:Uncharacterized protein n=1 Tax=Legionella clemsonensis TaxID=1867846 RepID=A0A222NYE0_9GAMM|nr:hypothetical protein [Legionella clemsonensis]ASQ44613.1 hypothetical protein clem_00230 [Legionella clemsonensis]